MSSIKLCGEYGLHHNLVEELRIDMNIKWIIGLLWEIIDFCNAQWYNSEIR